MFPSSVTFPGRFNGPPFSANGGYACGVIAGAVPGDLIEVTLRRPPPLDTPLGIELIGERYEVRDAAGEVIAVAVSAGDPVEPVPAILDVPDDALPALPDDRHPFRTCFTCGPDRALGDGLRIFVKRIVGQQILVDRWVPDDSFGDQIPPEVVWAALDCPGGWAAFDRIPGGVAVLGRMTTHIVRVPEVGEPCVVVAASNWNDGRKIDAHSSLYSAGGELLAAARAIWIDVTA
ncbi:MAG: hypothetical protein KDB71_02685 [Mycobacterium sp.]|nr:hypothetical protein [Mycobacterium sp.]